MRIEIYLGWALWKCLEKGPKLGQTEGCRQIKDGASGTNVVYLPCIDASKREQCAYSTNLNSNIIFKVSFHLHDRFIRISNTQLALFSLIGGGLGFNDFIPFAPWETWFIVFSTDCYSFSFSLCIFKFKGSRQQ